jgi:hypothetical protein
LTGQTFARQSALPKIRAPLRHPQITHAIHSQAQPKSHNDFGKGRMKILPFLFSHFQ